MSADQHPLDRVKRQLEPIVPLIGRDRPMLYLDYPIHENIGDLLINAGTERFFEEHGLRVWRRHSIFDFPPGAYGKLPPGTVVVLHGGGNFGDIWVEHQEFRERVVREFPEQRIVAMPQTVHFRDGERARRAFATLAAHRDLHLFVRDRVSERTLREGGMRNVALAPDMAHALWPTLRAAPGRGGREALHMYRDDIESGAVPADLVGHRGAALDWADSVPAAHFALFRAVRKLHVLAGHAPGRLQLSSLWYPVRDRIIADGIAMFSGRSQIVTNRLHGVILAALLELPVVAFDNSYGKLSTYIDAWLPDLPGLELRRAPAERSSAAAG